jgi:hypothetical protein
MIQKFVDGWFANREKVRAQYAATHPETYQEIVRAVVEAIRGEEKYGWPDPSRIHVIDDGDYQGTLVFVIAGADYQPSDYWYVKVAYGSCSVCDTLQSIRYDYSDDTSDAPSEKQVEAYMTLALHIVQGLKKMGDTSDS